MKREKVNIFQAFCITLPRVARVSPGFFALWMAASVAHGIAYGVIAPVTQFFFDGVADLAAHRAGVAAVIAGLAALTLAHAVKQALNGAANFMNTMYYRKAEGALSGGLHEKMSRLDAVVFEDTNALDGINKAVKGKNEAVWFTGTMLLAVNFYLPYFLCVALYLHGAAPQLTLAVALVFAPTLLAQICRTKVFAKAEDLSAPVRRRADYYEACVAERETFRETRVLGAFSYFRALFADAIETLHRLRFRASVKSALAETAMQLLSLAGYVGILLMLVLSLTRGEIGVGAFAAIFGSVDQMFSLMREIVTSNFGAVARDFGRVQNYVSFMRMPERGGSDMPVPGDRGIELEGVSFSYPGAGRRAVDAVTARVRPGETVAIVGENGSGKSTLVRLMTGVYLPDEGSVRHGGVDTRAASARSVYRNSSAVFQQYRRYQMTLRENIGIGDVHAPAEGEALDEASLRAGIDRDDARFPDGYDTMLSREFGGVDLSGGAWQRVAIARGFFRPHQIIALDEPTAAIDPIEETRIYQRFAENARGKTALIVTHRLGSVAAADRIFVMKEGRLNETGTHGELLLANGEYARLYRSQEQWYVTS